MTEGIAILQDVKTAWDKIMTESSRSPGMFDVYSVGPDESWWRKMLGKLIPAVRRPQKVNWHSVFSLPWVRLEKGTSLVIIHKLFAGTIPITEDNWREDVLLVKPETWEQVQADMIKREDERFFAGMS